AIPARIVNFVYQSLKKYGHVPRIEIGVVPQTITPTMAEGLGLAQDWGVVIADVARRGPADAAGIQPGDIILAVDGHPVMGVSALAALLYLRPHDQTLKIDVLRGRQKLSFKVGVLLEHDRIDQLADVAAPMKTHLGTLGILVLSLDDKLRSLMPDVRIGAGV